MTDPVVSSYPDRYHLTIELPGYGQGPIEIIGNELDLSLFQEIAMALEADNTAVHTWRVRIERETRERVV